jgi:predicted nuclease with RNAse H fold
MRAVGISISATEGHASGVATIEDNKIRTFTVYKNPEIFEIITRFNPDVVSINAPLVLSKNSYRAAEKELVAMGYNPEPQNMGDNKQKTKRAIEIRTFCLHEAKIREVIECHVPSAKKALNVSEPKQLTNIRVMNLIKNEFEKDAIFAAITAMFYKEESYEEFGDDEEGKIILPKVDVTLQIGFVEAHFERRKEFRGLG